MQVDGALVHRRERALQLDEAEHGAGARVDDGDRRGAGRAQRHAACRVVASRPDDAGGCPPQLAALHQSLRPLQRGVAQRLAVALVERRLEGRREHVAVQDPRVGMVEDRRLDPALQQRLGLAHEELVERVLAGDEHRQAVTAATGASPLLPQARHRAREADRDGAVEEADVDAELQRVGGRDAEQLSLDQPPLDLPPLRGRVAGAVGRQPGRRLRVEALRSEAVDELDGLAALGEADRAQAARDKLREEPGALPEGAGAEL